MLQHTTFFTERCWYIKGDEVKKVLDNAIEIVNFIKDPCMQECLKTKLKSEQGAHKSSYRNSVACQRKSSQQDIWVERWIARVHTRKYWPDFAECFGAERWLQKLVYLVDIFHHMNQWDQFLQGSGENCFLESNKVLRLKRHRLFGTITLPKELLKCFHSHLGLRMKKR